MKFLIGFATGWFGMVILVLIIDIIIDSQLPSAMDVYQGKTTLEITYKDSIPVDSVVVFKDK